MSATTIGHAGLAHEGRASTYAALLAEFQPKIVSSEEENESYIAAVYELEQRQENNGNWTQDDADFAGLLTLLIEDYEEKHYQLPKSSPVEVLRFLMEQHGLKQKDLATVFGAPSIVSEVLNGKRQMNKEHIRRLSERFHVSPELFF